MKKKQDAQVEWDTSEVSAFDLKAYEKSLRLYIKPISKHDCEKRGCNNRLTASLGVHKLEEVWDDFDMSQRDREKGLSAVLQARGRNQENIILRRYVSTVDGAYILRFDVPNEVQRDIRFDTDDESIEYYNYCLSLFKFTEARPIEVEGTDDFFADLDDMSGGFFDDLDEIGIEWDTD